MTTRQTRTTLFTSATATALSLAVLVGCGTTSTTAAGSTTSAGSAPASASAPMPAAPAAPAGPHQQADINFAQQMTVHHQGAIAMADLAAARASSSQVKTLAAQIKAAQAPEITLMAGWLAAWLPATATATAGSTGAMPGMMSDAQMNQLTAATGAAFDQEFLRLMIEHHQGALTMAQTETAQGKNPDALALAQSITTSQTAQITQMKAMLAGM